MTTLNTTLPDAIDALYAHFQIVQSKLFDLSLGVTIGPPISQVENNFLTVGDPETGELFNSYLQDFRGMPAVAGRKEESYSIPCGIRVWDGDSNPLDRARDLVTIFDAVLAELQSDPGGEINGFPALSPSGSWNATMLVNHRSGNLGGKGWGMIATFQVEVINVIINAQP
jgi:hypothetical protein